MPLTMVRTGEAQVIRKIGGNEETKRFLENLGFVAGAVVTVVSTISGNMIVNVKDSGYGKKNYGLVGGKEDADLEGNSMRHDRNCEEVKRRGRSQTPDYGYGDYKRLFCICQEGCTARGPGGSNGARI